MKELLALLEKIKERPGVYLGRKSLALLDPFMSGYVACLMDMRKDTQELIDFLRGFQEYIEEKYRLGTTHGAADLIQFFSLTDEDAFDKFFEYWEEYIQFYKAGKMPAFRRKKQWFEQCCLSARYDHMREKTLIFKKYIGPSHDHCEFCWARFSEDMSDDHREGYVTQDGDYWVCEECFCLFRSEFELTEEDGKV